MPGSTSAAMLPSTGARANSARPTAAQARPKTSGPRSPKRVTTRADRPS